MSPNDAPFYRSALAGAPTQRFLLVSHCFPPDSSIGALRWQKLCELAAGRGYASDVLMMDPTEAVVRDDSRLLSLPAGTVLHAVRYNEHLLMRTERRLRALLLAGESPYAHAKPAIGDARSDAIHETSVVHQVVATVRRDYLAVLFQLSWGDWADRVAQRGIALARTAKFRFVASSGPPHMAHEAARRIAEATGLPLVLDFRDLWALREVPPAHLMGSVRRYYSYKIESACVEAATLVVTNTQPARRALADTYPARAERIITVMNGADSDARAEPIASTRFTVIHPGSLYGGRDPRGLLSAARLLVDRTGATPDQFCLRFMGDTEYEGRSLSDLASEIGVDGHVLIEPARPRAEALQALRSAAVAVMLPQEHEMAIPGKLFEYVQQDLWILCLSAPHTAMARALEGTSADVVRPDRVEQIADVLVQHYREFNRGERPVAVNRDGQFDRERQADILFAAIEELTPRR